MTTTARLAADLTAIVGQRDVLVDRDIVASYESDWTGRFAGTACLVVRPADTAAAAEVMSCCARHGVPVCTQGGNTGLVGGSVPRGGEVVLSTVRMTVMEPVDALAGQVTAGAGVTLAALQAHASSSGLAYGVDFAARDSATVGGMIATNAGGIHVLRYGSTRHQVLGLEVVLADGSIISRMGGLVKDNSGYDLASLIVGSEGTLAVITRARLRLVAHQPARVVALLATASTEDALSLFVTLRNRMSSLTAAEIVYADGVDLVCAHSGMAPPFARRHPVTMIVECADSVDPTDALAAALDGAPQLIETAVADDGP
ncbi:MAG: FAD-binding oxidoreductase, partial [Ilumatobacteraceae bacterium]